MPPSDDYNPHNTESNRGTLAEDMISGWDHEAIQNYAVKRLKDSYKNDHDDFLYDWRGFYGVDEGE